MRPSCVDGDVKPSLVAERRSGSDVPDGRHRSRRGGRTAEFDVTTLLTNAPPDSIRQTIKVEREEEEILGPLPDRPDGGPDGMLNYDTVSENVDLGIVDGTAQLAVKVRCERIVPIRGVADMFKKSSVLVTRLIEIDLRATEDRRRLYDYVMRRSSERDVSGGGGGPGVRNKLSTKDTFKLYKAFMSLAEADEAQGGALQRETLQIDRKLEDQGRLDLNRLAEQEDSGGGRRGDGGDDDNESDFFDVADLQRRLDRNLPAEAFGLRRQESDSVSYTSGLSGPSDILY